MSWHTIQAYSEFHKLEAKITQPVQMVNLQLEYFNLMKIHCALLKCSEIILWLQNVKVLHITRCKYYA